MNINFSILIALLLVTRAGYGQTPLTLKPLSTRHGPENGSLLIIGGGGATPAIWEKFTTLAGGPDSAKVVVITAASGDSAAYRTDAVDLVKKETGIRSVTLLHAKDLKEANDERFIRPIREATAIYFIGGRQWRIADLYLNTASHQAFLDLLDRGGIIAGTSAGATIQGSFLWRGDTRGAQFLIGDHLQGLGFLRNAVIDQHLLRRNRQFDLIGLIKIAPELVGIGLDEATSVLVQKDTLEVIGRSYAAIYDYDTLTEKIEEARYPDTLRERHQLRNGFLLLKEGDRYDLKERQIIRALTALEKTTQ